MYGSITRRRDYGQHGVSGNLLYAYAFLGGEGESFDLVDERAMELFQKGSAQRKSGVNRITLSTDHPEVFMYVVSVTFTMVTVLER